MTAGRSFMEIEVRGEIKCIHAAAQYNLYRECGGKPLFPPCSRSPRYCCARPYAHGVRCAVLPSGNAAARRNQTRKAVFLVPVVLSLWAFVFDFGCARTSRSSRPRAEGHAGTRSAAFFNAAQGSLFTTARVENASIFDGSALLFMAVVWRLWRKRLSLCGGNVLSLTVITCRHLQ
eukprot:3939788-Rhodomonas_salina.1